MAHILYKLGEAALRQRRVGGKLLPPVIGYGEAMKLREQFYKEQQPWPYEHIVPGPAQPPVGIQQYLKRKDESMQKKQERAKEIESAMAKMPQLIQQYRASRKMDWSEVDDMDYLTMTRTAIRKKYIKKRLQKQM